jgi:chromosome segregation ATPase
LHLAEFRNREEELKNALAASKSKVRDLEISLREVDAGGRELKRVMKKATDSEYAISQKLAYEKGARWGLEVEFEVVLKSLQSDQITIAVYEVELNDLKGVASYVMDFIAVPYEAEGVQSLVDHLIDTPVGS